MYRRGLTKSLETKLKTPLETMEWLTSNNSTEPVQTFVRICRRAISNPLFLKTISVVKLMPLLVVSWSAIEIMLVINLQKNSVCLKITITGCKV